ncbi:MAG TPA: mevalonate kinase [Candidatus Woesebacteria bacterium]|nr:mevalonate kinase [Candidatus Woesebacteria bacterium]
MKKITVSAPGKLMLFGEHAVVYGSPCIVTAVNHRMKVTVEENSTNELVIQAPDVQITNYKKHLSKIEIGNIPKGAQFIEKAVANFFQIYPFKTGITITTASEFSSLFGFGSSSASTVCVIKALAEIYSISLSQKELFDLAYKTVLDIQQKGSGFDIASAIYGGTIYFITSGTTIEKLPVESIPLTVAYSGVKADTTTLVNNVANLKKQNPELVNGLFMNIAQIVEEAKTALLQKDWKTLGQLMDSNQLYLDQLEIMTDKLSTLINAAKQAGALGTKISGAGGGDCIIALSPEYKTKIEQTLEQTDAHIIQVEANVEGVRIEK